MTRMTLPTLAALVLGGVFSASAKAGEFGISVGYGDPYYRDYSYVTYAPACSDVVYVRPAPVVYYDSYPVYRTTYIRSYPSHHVYYSHPSHYYRGGHSVRVYRR